MEGAGKLKLTVVTPERSLVDGVLCEEVVLPGELGELGILPGHAALVSLIGAGVMTWKSGRDGGALAVAGGFAEVANDVVRVLADRASTKADVDAAAARHDRDVAQKRRLDVHGDEELAAASADAAYAAARLRIAGAD